MAEQASDYHHGEMDIHEQAATFNLVMAMTKWGSLYLAAALLWLTLMFCTATGFVGSSISAVVLIVLGTLLLRKKSGAGH